MNRSLLSSRLAATTSMTIAESKQRIVNLAREQLGSHYLRRACGHTPGQPNATIVPTTRDYVRDPVNDLNHEPVPMLNAAYSIMNRVTYVCAGICGHRTSPIQTNRRQRNEQVRQYARDHENEGQQLNATLWPRPEEVIDSRSMVWGESCWGRKHFDCVGLVNFCFLQVCGTRSVNSPISIEQWLYGRGRPVEPGGPRPYQLVRKVDNDFEPCDLAFKGTHHVGIVTGTGTIVEAKGYQHGVVESSFNASNWDFVGRPVRSLFPR